MILLSLSSWGSYEELGGRVKDGTEQKQAAAGLAEGAWLPSLLLRATPGSRALLRVEVLSPLPSCAPCGVMLCLYILYKGTCPYPL